MRAALALAAACIALAVPAARAQSGKAIYDEVCGKCHGIGLIGAPKPGDREAWAPRIAKGMDALYRNAVAGTPRGMPPKGGKAELSEAQVRSATDYMVGGLAGAKVAAAPARPAAPSPQASARPAAPAAQVVASAPNASAAAPPPAAPTAAPPAAPAAAPPAAAGAAPAATVPSPPPGALAAAGDAEVNAFNRLLRPPSQFNRPAAESGIHDPANDMTHQLQPPGTAFAKMPKSVAGNRVDWVKALDGKAIAPRWDRADGKAQPVVLDLNIVREVKGSMPDVVYPHRQHTEWLDCANCHPKVFVPQKGANQISMASILLGQQCGLCHGKVAFPVSECRLCHSRKKDAGAATAARAK